MSILKRIFGFLLRYKWRVLIAALILVPLSLVLMFALSPTVPEYITDTAKRGDLEQTVEAVGTVISERDLELQFATAGVVAQVYVKEGDVVTSGQRLAVLKAGNLSADIASAAARLQQAQADLNARLEGTRPEDIAVSEAEVASKQAALETAKISLKTAEESYAKSQEKLEALREQARISLAGDVTNAASTITKELTTAQNSLSVAKDIMNNNDVIDAMTKFESSDYTEINTAIQQANTKITSLFSQSSPADYEAALAALDATRLGVNQTLSVVNVLFITISDLPISGSFTESAKQGYKSELTTERSTLQTSFNTLDSEASNLRNASASYQTQIASEESSVTSAQGSMNKATSDIATYEASLRIAQAQLQLKKAPTRKSDIDSATANVNQARAALARTQADYSNTVLTAPIAGRITKVNVKPGEFTPSGAAVTMLGNSPYRIEMYVSEIDVPKVYVTQTGSIELDAFRGTNFKLHVSDLDSAATDRDGVPKYRVRLDFTYPHTELKIGMTGDAAIVTGVEKDVVSVPLRSVLENEDGDSYVRIMKEDGTVEEREVVTGLEGVGGLVQVTGVEEGETVIVLEKK